jgi:hypothetical protein
MVARRFAFRPFFQTVCKARSMGFWAELRLLLREQVFPSRIGRAKDEDPSPPLVFRMATAYWVSQAIYVAAKLGIADLLKDSPQSCLALAKLTGTDPPSLFRLLRALASVGVFEQVGKDFFALSRLAEPLRSDGPGSLRALLTTIGEIHYQACGNLLHSVQTGSPAFNTVFGTDLFDYFHLNTEAAAAFNRGMTNISSKLAYAVLMAYDFSGIASIVDVGGGEGELLRRILEFNPDLRGAVFDMPGVIERATPTGIICEGRLSYIAGNFFASVPAGARAYLLCNVVHDWGGRPRYRCPKELPQSYG